MKLNDQEKAFAHNLVSGMTIVDAAKNAGYADSTARDRASTWIGDDRSSRYKPHLVKYIEQLRSEIVSEVKKTNIASLEEVMEFQTKVLRSKINNVVKFDGFGSNPKSFDEMDEDTIAIIQELHFKKGQGTTIKLYSKMDASRELTKFHGGYKPSKTEISGPDGGPIETKSLKDYSNLDPEELETLIKLEEKANNE